MLWPGRGSGVNLVRRWGIAEPRPDQVEHAVGYLKRRRLLYVVLAPVAMLLAPADRTDPHRELAAAAAEYADRAVALGADRQAAAAALFAVWPPDG